MKTITLIFMAAILFTFSSQAQTVITVDNTEGADADYSDLQSAITNATSGDIIYVHASELNYLDITIDKPLTLIGFSHSDADKETMVRNIVFGQDASNVRITGLHITDDFIVNNPVMISNLVIENNLFDGPTSSIIAFSGGGADNVIFRGNIIETMGSNTTSPNANVVTNLVMANNIIRSTINVRFHESTTIENNIFIGEPIINNISSDTGDLEIQDCIFYASSNSIYDPNNDGIIFNNCLTYNDLNGVANLVGNGNINDTDPLFVSASDDTFDPFTDDYTLQGGSPALGMGVDSDDIGLYSTNTNFTFNNLGFTAGIPIVTITAITSQIAPGGELSVTIQSNSN